MKKYAIMTNSGATIVMAKNKKTAFETLKEKTPNIQKKDIYIY